MNHYLEMNKSPKLSKYFVWYASLSYGAYTVSPLKFSFKGNNSNLQEAQKSTNYKSVEIMNLDISEPCYKETYFIKKLQVKWSFSCVIIRCAAKELHCTDIF